MDKVSIILPLFNGEKYIKKLISSIREQDVNFELEIIAAVSKSTDNSFYLAEKLCDIVYQVEIFNHAKTRHEAALRASGEILVFITQDIIPFNNYWLQNLVTPLKDNNNNIVATYSKQVAHPDASETEKLIRKFNYPDYNRLCNNKTKYKWGRKNIFYSDTSSATIKGVFLELGGYNFEVGTNEDVIYALNVINNEKSILYNSESIVYHSHDFKIKSAYNRYKLIGEFEKKYIHELKSYSSLSEGRLLLNFLLRNLIKKFKLKDLGLLGIDLLIRYLAYRKGYKSI
ncbi:glycosyltransferase [Gracilibacillus massiliensis]|uniref:glycosyltransferase n=1 Tax=Gracilibacillus massiliensis TaxID=1564956 RepID=UPI00071DFA33|nr:glycosyltransferase [Gracilibacillus massiliensis]